MRTVHGNALFWVCDKVWQDAYDVKWHLQALRTWLTTKASTTQAALIRPSAHGIYTRIIHPWYSHGPSVQAL